MTPRGGLSEVIWGQEDFTRKVPEGPPRRHAGEGWTVRVILVSEGPAGAGVR